jgi:8-oxo-dGTP diphosphatase
MKRQVATSFLAVDAVIFGFDGERLSVLLTKRLNNPFSGYWSLPGGLLRVDETTNEAVKRVLQEKTGLKKVYLEQLYTFSDPSRDARMRVVSVAHYALVRSTDHEVVAGRHTELASWFDLEEKKKLAFDHRKILECAIERIRGQIRYKPIGFELLPARFTLTQLQKLYEAILNQKLDKRNFRKKILAMDLLEGLEEKEIGVGRKPAQYWRFDKKKYQNLTQKGFVFEL